MVLQQQSTDFEWFKNNYNEICKEYNGRFVVIKNKTIIGDYSSYSEAVRSTEQTEARGTYIVQHCNGEESGYTNYISSMNFMGVI